MNNTLLDNSEKFLMRDILQQFIGSGKYNHICIATAYWDLPGTALVYDLYGLTEEEIRIVEGN